MGKATPKLVATGSHTPRLEGWKEEVVVPQLRAWGCLMDPETTKDTDTKGVVQPLLGRHQRQRRKGEIFLLSGLSFLSGKPCRTPADMEHRLPVLLSPPCLPKHSREGWGMNLKTNRPWFDPLPKGDALGIMPVLCILSPTYMSLSTRYSV